MRFFTCKFLMTLVSVVVVSSCVYNVDSYISQFESFVESVEQNRDITESEYSQIKKEFIDYSEIYYNKYKADLTSTQKSTIRDLKIRYYSVIASNELDDVVNELEKIGVKAIDFINKMME
ncbi:MAG: DUF6565 domain-containing protein [Rikenellaceae bacterium]